MPIRQIASFRLVGVVAALILLPLVGCGQEGQNGLGGSVGTGTGMAEMSWEAPTTNSDGTPLTQLAGYRIYYGTTSPLDKSTSLSIDVGTDTSFTLSGLDAGTYFFAATAYDAMGNESALSEEASKTITAS
jgi:hypothetical protein